MARHEFRKVVRGTDGLPVEGAEVRFYEPGTTTPRPVYETINGSTPALPPIESDANGVVLAYLPPGLIYKVVTTFDAVTDTIENYPAVDPIPSGNWLVPYRDGDGALMTRVMADGRGIFEADPVTDALAQFLAGGTFTVSPGVSRHRWLKVGDTSSGLTQNMTVAVDKTTPGWVAGDSVIVVKGDTSVRTITVSGLDEDGLGTTTLRRSRDFVMLLVQSTDSSGIKFERGPQGRINPDAEDVAYDGGTVADKLAELSVSVPQSYVAADEVQDWGTGEKRLIEATVELAAAVDVTGALTVVVDSTDYSSTPFQVVNGELRFLTGAFANQIVFPTGLGANARGEFDNRSGAAMVLKAASGVTLNEVSEGEVALIGRASWVRQAENAIIVVGAIAAPVIIAGPVSGQQGLKFNNLTGAQTLSVANFRSGAELFHSGAAATYTLPSRVTATGITERLVVFNRGSGDITFSASGPTLQTAATIVAPNGAAVLTWEYDGTTEKVWTTGAEEPA